MNFAKKQLEKFGWKDGEGLGKSNQGITTAIKPQLKTGKEGMGFDLSKELTDTWWTKAYTDSLSRINVNDTNDDVQVAIQGDDDEKRDRKKAKKRKGYEVMDNAEEERPMERMKKRMLKANFTSFSKGGTLSNGELIQEAPLLGEDEDLVVIKETKKSAFKVLNDEELFKACGGRTLHKAARFGHKLHGKLARLAAQEDHKLSLPEPTPREDNKASEEESSPKQKMKKQKKIKSEEQVLTISEPEVENILVDDITDNCFEQRKKRKKEKKSKLLIESEDSLIIIENSSDLVSLEVDKKLKKKKKKDK